MTTRTHTAWPLAVIVVFALSLTFSEFVQAAGGNITIHLSDGTVVETIDVTSGAVVINGTEAIIDPAGDLVPLTAYYVTIAAGAFTDLAGNPFAGISDSATWAFTTIQPLLAYYPFDSDFTDASGSGNDLTIALGTPTITTTTGEFVVGGGALDVDSTTGDEEFLDLTTPIAFGEADPWSVAFWARRRPGTDNRSGMVIGDTANNTDFIWLSDNPAQVRGLRFRSSANTNANFGGWELTLKAAGNTDYEFRSSTTLDFNPGTLVENLIQETPATDPGTIGGTNDSVVTTDGNGDATVRLTLTGNPADFVRATTP